MGLRLTKDIEARAGNTNVAISAVPCDVATEDSN